MDRRVYAPDAAFTHMCLYAVVRAFTRAVGAYTHLAYMLYVYGSCAPGCVYARVGGGLRERWVCIHRGCVHAPHAYTQVSAYMHPRAPTAYM